MISMVNRTVVIDNGMGVQINSVPWIGITHITPVIG